MFKPRKYDSGKTMLMKTATGTPTTNDIDKGDALEISGGYVQKATGTTTDVRFVALEDKVISDTAHYDILCLLVDGVEFEADTNENMNQTYVGTRCDLTDEATLDENSASTNHVFFITAVVGATTDKKAKGYFVIKTS